MKESRIVRLLECLGSSPPKDQTREGWVVSHCPWAPWDHDSGIDKTPSFGVRIKPGGESFYNCWSCKNHGDLTGLVRDLNEAAKGTDIADDYDWKSALRLTAEELDEPIDVDLPDECPIGKGAGKKKEIIWPEYFLDSFKPAKNFPQALEYLMGRQVTPQVVADLDLRFDPSKYRVCFPIRNWQGFLTGLHGRIITSKPPPYWAYGFHNQRNPIVWLGENWIDPDKPVVLVESVFDLARVYRVYRNVMCALSAGISKHKVRRINGLRNVVTLFDWGKGGEAARGTLTKYLTIPYVHLVPTEDEGDPGNMEVDRIAEVLDGHIVFEEFV